MRILFITMLEAQWGGSELLWEQTALELRRRGVAVGFVLPWPKTGEQVDELRRAGASAHSEIPGPERWWRRMWRPKRPLQERRRRILREWKPDLVLFSQPRQDAGADWAGVLAAEGIPHAVLIHGISADIWLPETTADMLVSFYNGARQVYFVSERGRTDLQAQLGLALARSSVVRNPFGVPFEEPLIWPAGTTLKLGMAARLEPSEKGHDLGMRALATAAWAARPVELHCFGTGEGEKRLRRLSAMLHLEKRVFFRGYAKPADIWRECHVAFMPSRQEGMPISLVEAMLMGRPAVVTDVGGNGEIVREGREGFVAEAATVPAIAAALERMWSARERLPAMGAQAQAHIRTQVPPSPAGVFAEMLLQLAAGK